MSAEPEHWAELIDWTHEDHWAGADQAQQDHAALDRAAGLTTLTLQIVRWAPLPHEPQASKKKRKAVKGFTLTVYELATDADQQDQRESIGKFTFSVAPPRAKEQPMVISTVTWDASLRYAFEAFPRKRKRKKESARDLIAQRDNADLVLYLGGTHYYLRLPNPLRELDRRYEIGFSLEDDQGGRVERLSADSAFVPKVAWRDWVARMRRLPGRFDSPNRSPQVPNAEVEVRLEPEALALLEQKKGGADVEVDADGLRFDHFLPTGKNRPQVVQELIAGSPYLKDAGDAEGAQWKQSDIVKAYFIVHDVGTDGLMTEDRFFPPTAAGVQFKKDDAGRRTTTPVNVHGFVNWGGKYAASWDFEEPKSGTVYEFSHKGGRLMTDYSISIETTPIYEKIAGADKEAEYKRPADYAKEEALVREANVKRKAKKKKPKPEWNIGGQEFLCIGHKTQTEYVKQKNKKKKKKVTSTKLYKWTRALMECLADLYIVASARAGHLLTVTAHMEMDQSLCWSVVYPEVAGTERHYLRAGQKGHGTPLATATATQRQVYTKSGFRRGVGKKVRDKPQNMHNDPQGMDMQVLYDLISERLNALGGYQMPTGIRYGVHPRRVSGPPKEPGKTPSIVRTLGNKTYRLNTFPHQSYDGWHTLDGDVASEKVLRSEIANWKKNTKTWWKS